MRDTIIAIAALAALAAACVREDAPRTEPDRSRTACAPRIVLEATSAVLYPAESGLSEEIGFSVESAGEVSLSVSPGEDVNCVLTFDAPAGKGSLRLSAGETFRTGTHVFLRADDGTLSSQAELYAVPASVAAQDSPVKIGCEAGRTAVPIRCNVPVAAESDSGWLQVEGDSSPLTLVFRENGDVLEGRTAVVTVSDARTGLVRMAFAVVQSPAGDPLAGLTDMELMRRIYDRLTVTPKPSPFAQGKVSGKEDYLVGWFGDDPGDWSGVAFSGDRVIYLHLQDIPFSCALPEEIGYLTALRELRIAGETVGGVKAWRGGIPRSFGKLKNLRELSLNNTALCGEIPEWLASLGSLRILSLADSDFSGGLPVFLADMPSLERFWFHGCRLSGEIDPRLTGTVWWNWGKDRSGMSDGERNLEIGQQYGYALWVNYAGLNSESPGSIQ